MKFDLIQRGTFKDVKDADVQGIDSVVSFDYMGSSEFEWGALPAALKEFLPYFNKYSVHKTKLKAKDGRGLFVLCPEDLFEAVLTGLTQMAKDKRDGGLQLKERSQLYDALTPDKEWPVRIDFWWDIKNNWFAGLGKNNVERLQVGLTRLRDRWIAEKKITAQ